MEPEKYIISIEKNGRMVPVGSISGEDYRTARFSYRDEYLDDADAVPVSISLPLQRESFSAEQTRQFFEGLLPEGFTRRSVAQWLHLDENDYLSILHQLGRECLGAIRVLKEGETQTASYEMITRQQVKALAAEGAQKSAEIVTRSHLSLTGASGKVGLYYDSTGNQWYLPQGTAPSTHIVKQSHVRLEGIVTNEQLSMMAAAKCGIEVIIIMPHIPDKWYAFYLAKTYYEELMQAGVQIYEYTPGFVHAKVFVSDNDTATVGTINLDYRSLYHHFECGAFIYNNPVVWDIERDFQATLKKCQKVTLMDLKSRSLTERVTGKILRLVAPLM